MGLKQPLELKACVKDKLFSLLSRILSVDGWVIKLPVMSSRIILRDFWPDYRDRLMCSRKVFSIFIKRMHELFCGLLLNQLWLVAMHELFSRNLP